MYYVSHQYVSISSHILGKADNFVVDVVVVVVVVVVTLLVVAYHTIFSCHQWILFWGLHRLLLSFCGGVGWGLQSHFKVMKMHHSIKNARRWSCFRAVITQSFISVVVAVSQLSLKLPKKDSYVSKIVVLDSVTRQTTMRSQLFWGCSVIVVRSTSCSFAFC